MADKEFCGKPYRQMSRRLRIACGSGRPDKVSERPFQGNARDGTIIYLDSDAAPTLIRFDELDIVDVPSLLRLGAIVEYTPPEALIKRMATKEAKADE